MSYRKHCISSHDLLYRWVLCLAKKDVLAHCLKKPLLLWKKHVILVQHCGKLQSFIVCTFWHGVSFREGCVFALMDKLELSL